MKINYKQKLFLCFVVIFTLFTIGIIVFQQSREREYKTDILKEKLDAYANMVDRAQVQYDRKQSALDSLVSLFPKNIRLTLIDKKGIVLYDNVIDDVATMENHANRVEIIKAQEMQRGSDIRTSSSDEHEYLYYAKRFNNYFVRVALPYDIQIRHFLKADNMFLYYILGIFVITLVIISYAAGRFSKSIQQLKEFTDAAEDGTVEMRRFNFPDDELGEIGDKIARNYNRLKESKKEITHEREKLLQHVHSSEEGLCFFTANREVEFYNGLFVRYLNTIVDEANSEPLVLFTDPAFHAVIAFLSEKDNRKNYFETKISKQGKTFITRVNRFENNGFEIIINDVTRQEKTRLLKQEMTGNITHELRTPVTGIRGCLETVLEQPLDSSKSHYFIQSAYNQVLTLSDLIQDMGLITKIEDAPQSFRMEPVAIGALIANLKKDLERELNEKNISMEWNISDSVVVMGNRNLLYSIFRNLTDNVIRYAGSDVRIQINKYNDDRQFYYFSFADDGIGIPHEYHLNRLFERFYRIDEGRTRDAGGSGLGLSIVKNAIAFHKGSIVAKNRIGGGLEFLFQLKIK